MREKGIYVASKTKHGPMWQALKEKYNIISSWIYHGVIADPKVLSTLWENCLKDVSQCRALVVYRDSSDEILKGAFIEVGAALAFGIPVHAVGCDNETFTRYKLVTTHATLEEALEATVIPEIKITPYYGEPYEPWVPYGESLLEKKPVEDNPLDLEKHVDTPILFPYGSK